MRWVVEHGFSLPEGDRAAATRVRVHKGSLELRLRAYATRALHTLQRHAFRRRRATGDKQLDSRANPPSERLATLPPSTECLPFSPVELKRLEVGLGGILYSM